MRVVAPGVRGLLRAPDKTTRAEAIGAFRALARSFPAAAPGAFAALADDADPEKDFFLNAAHLQAHRRAGPSEPCRCARASRSMRPSSALLPPNP